MSNSHLIKLDAALIGGDYAVCGPCQIRIADGHIKEIRELDRTTAFPGSTRLLGIPSLVDAHNHARPLSTTSFGCGGQRLETWLPQLAVMPSVDAYTAAAASFARSLRGGATSVMVHLTRPMGKTSLPEEAREIARAARDVGVSIGLAIAMRDRNPLIYADHAPLLEGFSEQERQLIQATWLRALPSVSEQMSAVEEVAETLSDVDHHVDVQYGPTGVQWCTDDLLTTIAKESERTGRRIHMHLLETDAQRCWADASYSEGIVNYLSDTGLLSPRLTLAHCVWARPDELDLIASSGARIAVSTSSNLHLYSGIASVSAMHAAGVEVGMGLDGCALDEDDDALRELRLFHLLNHSRGFNRSGISPMDALRAASVAGRSGLGLAPGGVLQVGMPADLLVLDLDKLDSDALMEVDPRHYLFSRATKEHIVDAYSAGRQVIVNGKLTGVDLPGLEEALRSEFRQLLADAEDISGLWEKLKHRISAHYQGCC